MTFTRSEVVTYYQSRIPALSINGQKEARCACPIHSGKDPNFAVNTESGLAQCHSQCGRGWDMISLEQELSGLDFPKAKERVYEIVGRPNVPWEERNFEALYDYTDASGKVLYQVVRSVGKKFSQRRPDGNGGWLWGLGNVNAVPFRLEKVIHSNFVAIVEGEKDVLTLERIGMIASCNNGGAEHFKAELTQYFAEKHIAIFPDNDDKGRSHALKVAALLSPVAKSIKIVELPELQPKEDVTDFVNKGHTLEDIRELYRKSKQWSPEWEFSSSTPDENDKYVRTIEQEISAAGGLTEFWNLAAFTGMPTPFRQLNYSLGGGMRNGEIYVIGANQGAGKTSLALQFGMAAMRNGFGVLMFSMEMGWRAVFHRMAGIEARVDLLMFRESQRHKHESKEDRLRLSAATADIASWKLLVSTRSAATPEYIVAETRRLAKRSKVDLVIVDHMQLMAAEQNTRSDYEKFTAISRAMKQTAVELDVPVILVSQTSRSNSRDRRAELDVSDLRGSGAIEEDAAGVFLLYEDNADAEMAKSVDDGRRYAQGPIKTVLRIGKNRYGVQGTCIDLLHFKTLTRFDLSTYESETE